MDIFYVLLACGVAGVLLFGMLRRKGGSPRLAEAALERDIQLLEFRLANTTEEFNSLQASVASMQGRLHTHAENAADRARQLKAAAERVAAEQREGLPERLQRKGFVTADQMAKAESYRRNTGNPLPVEEVLVLLGFVQPDTLRTERDEVRRLVTVSSPEAVNDTIVMPQAQEHAGIEPAASVSGGADPSSQQGGNGKSGQ